MGLDLQQVTAALQAQNAVTPAGRIRTSQENMSVEVSGAFTSVDSLRQIVLHTGNRFIPLTDLATVTLQQADPPSPEFRLTVNQHSGWRFRWLAVEILLILVGR